MSGSIVEDGRVKKQQLAYLRWLNHRLPTDDLESLVPGLCTGIHLYRLAEVLTKKKLSTKLNDSARSLPLHHVENVNAALEAFESDGLRTVNVGATDVCGGNLKIVMGLIWSIILKYELGGEREARAELLRWVNGLTRPGPYSLPDAKGFERDFEDGSRLLAAVHAVIPAAYDYAAESTGRCAGNPVKAVALALSAAELHLGLPRVIEVGHDCIDDDGDGIFEPEQNSVMTFLALLRTAQSEMRGGAVLPCDPPRCTAEGEGITCAREASESTFVVVTMDRLGTRRGASANARVAVTVEAAGTGQAVDNVSVADNGDGSFTCRYTPQRGLVDAGNDALTVSVDIADRGDGESEKNNEGGGDGGGGGGGPSAIAGSPFAVPLRAEYEGSGMTLSGSCLGPTAVAGVELDITLTVEPGFEAPPLEVSLSEADADADAASNDPGTVAATPPPSKCERGPEARPLSPVVDSATGAVVSRTVTMTIFRAGMYTVSAAGLPIPSEHSLRVLPAGLSPANSSLVPDRQLHSVEAPLICTIDARDTFGNAVRFSDDGNDNDNGLNRFALDVQPAEGTVVTMGGRAGDGDDGNCTSVSVSFPAPGRYTLTPSMGGRPMRTNALMIEVTAGEAPASGTVTVTGGGQVPAGETVRITAEGLVTASGAAISKGGHALVATITRDDDTDNVVVREHDDDDDDHDVGDDTLPGSSAMVDNRDGTYTCQLAAPARAGRYLVSVRGVGGDSAILGTAGLVVVPGPASTAHSTLRVSGTMCAGDPVTVSVVSRDALGNRCRRTGGSESTAADSITVEMAASGFSSEVTGAWKNSEPHPNNGSSGVWVGTAQPARVGRHTFTARGPGLGGGAPLTAEVDVSPGEASLGSCTLVVPPDAIVDAPLACRLDVADACGNPAPIGEELARVLESSLAVRWSGEITGDVKGAEEKTGQGERSGSDGTSESAVPVDLGGVIATTATSVTFEVVPRSTGRGTLHVTTATSNGGGGGGGGGGGAWSADVSVTAGDPPTRFIVVGGDSTGTTSATAPSGPLEYTHPEDDLFRDGLCALGVIAGKPRLVTVVTYRSGERMVTGGHPLRAYVERQPPGSNSGGASAAVPDAKEENRGDRAASRVPCAVTDRHDGTYTVCIDESVAGRVSFGIAGLGGSNGGSSAEWAPGFPLPLAVTAGELSPAACSVSGPSLLLKRQQGVYDINIRDAAGNAVPFVESEWTAALEGGEREDGGSATLAFSGPPSAPVVTVTPLVEGTYDLVLRRGGAEVFAAGTCPRVVVRTAGPTATHTTVTVGEGATGPFKCGMPVTIVVRLRDQDGPVAFEEGDCPVTLHVDGHGELRSHRATSSDANDAGGHGGGGGEEESVGVFTSKFIPTSLGEHTVTATLNGTHVQNSPASVTAVAGNASAEHTTATVECGSDVIPQRTGYKSESGENSESGNVTEAGLTSGSASAGDAVAPIVLSPGTSVRIAVVARDAYGHVVQATGGVRQGQLTARLFAPEPAGNSSPLGVVDCGDGSFAVAGGAGGDANSGAGDVVAFERGCPLGTYSVQVMLGGVAVRGSPLEFTVRTGASAAMSTAAFDGNPEKFTAHGGPYGLTIAAHGSNGERVHVGGDRVEVFALGPTGDKVLLDVTDVGDGTYTASFRPVAVGLHTVHPMFQGAPVGSVPAQPLRATVRSGAADGANCAAKGPGVSGDEPLTVDTPALFTVETRDAHGNPCEDGGGTSVDVTVTCTGTPVTAKVADAGDGTFSVAYTPECPGPHTVTVLVNGSPVSGSPFHVSAVPGRTCASMCTIESGPGTGDTPRSGREISAPPRTARAGETVRLWLVPRDAQGNRTRDSNCAIDWDVTAKCDGDEKGTPVSVRVEGTQDSGGEAVATLVPTRAGLTHVTARVGLVHLRNSPLAIAVAPSAAVRERAYVAVWNDDAGHGGDEKKRGVVNNAQQQLLLSGRPGAAAETEIDVTRPFTIAVCLFDAHGNAVTDSAEIGGGRVSMYGSPAAIDIPASSFAPVPRSGGGKSDGSTGIVTPAHHAASVSLAEGSPFRGGGWRITAWLASEPGDPVSVDPRLVHPCRHCKRRVECALLATHEETECPAAPHTCRHCGQGMTRGEKKAHDKVCPKRRVKCKECMLTVLQTEYKHHKRQCDLTMEARFQLSRLKPSIGCVVGDPVPVPGFGTGVHVLETKRQARAAGVEPEDVILTLRPITHGEGKGQTVKGEAVATQDKSAFGKAMAARQPGDWVRLRIARGRDILDIDVEIGDPSHPIETVRRWKRHAEGKFEEIDFVMEFAVQ